MARQGLYVGAKALGLGPGDEVLTPAYHHGSEIEALRRRGLNCRFYDLDSTLGPARAEVDSLVGPRTRALLLIHYFGFPQDVEHWRAWCDQRGLLFLEDVAQGFLGSRNGRPLGSLGDLAIFCPYKTVGLPRVGLLHLPRLTFRPGAIDSGGFGFTQVARLAAKAAVTRYGWLGSIGRRLEARGNRKRDADDQALGKIAESSLSSRILLGRLHVARVASLRRANYLRLLEDLSTVAHPALRDIPMGAAPLIFPIVSGDSSGLIAQLNARGILASRFWQHPHPELAVDRYPIAGDLRERLVALPVHQLLEERDLAAIASVTKGAAGVGGSEPGGGRRL
jgi:dTDP-4-amino-4,6-dideoxygalactose transaminase